MFLSFVGLAYVALADKYIPDDLILAGMSIVFAGLIILGTSLWSSVILPWLKKILTRKDTIEK